MSNIDKDPNILNYVLGENLMSSWEKIRLISNLKQFFNDIQVYKVQYPKKVESSNRVMKILYGE